MASSRKGRQSPIGSSEGGRDQRQGEVPARRWPPPAPAAGSPRRPGPAAPDDVEHGARRPVRPPRPVGHGPGHLADEQRVPAGDVEHGLGLGGRTRRPRSAGQLLPHLGQVEALQVEARRRPVSAAGRGAGGEGRSPARRRGRWPPRAAGPRRCGRRVAEDEQRRLVGPVDVVEDDEQASAFRLRRAPPGPRRRTPGTGPRATRRRPPAPAAGRPRASEAPGARARRRAPLGLDATAPGDRRCRRPAPSRPTPGPAGSCRCPARRRRAPAGRPRRGPRRGGSGGHRARGAGRRCRRRPCRGGGCGGRDCRSVRSAGPPHQHPSRGPGFSADGGRCLRAEMGEPLDR